MVHAIRSSVYKLKSCCWLQISRSEPGNYFLGPLTCYVFKKYLLVGPQLSGWPQLPPLRPSCLMAGLCYSWSSSVCLLWSSESVSHRRLFWPSVKIPGWIELHTRCDRVGVLDLPSDCSYGRCNHWGRLGQGYAGSLSNTFPTFWICNYFKIKIKT